MAVASALVSERPDETCAELKGPRARSPVSTPETESVETLMGDICVWACWEEEPKLLAEDPEPADGAAPPELACAWANFPFTFMMVMLILPVASLTPSSEAICASFVVEIDCWPGLVITRERVNFCPCLDWSGGCMPKLLRAALVHLLLLRDGDVGAHAVQRLEHLVLGPADAGGVGGHRHHEGDADGEPEGGEQRLAMPPAQLPEHVSEEHAASSSAAAGTAGYRRPPPGYLLGNSCTSPAWEAPEARLRGL